MRVVGERNENPKKCDFSCSHFAGNPSLFIYLPRIAGATCPDCVFSAFFCHRTPPTARWLQILWTKWVFYKCWRLQCKQRKKTYWMMLFVSVKKKNISYKIGQTPHSYWLTRVSMVMLSFFFFFIPDGIGCDKRKSGCRTHTFCHPFKMWHPLKKAGLFVARLSSFVNRYSHRSK